MSNPSNKVLPKSSSDRKIFARPVLSREQSGLLLTGVVIGPVMVVMAVMDLVVAMLHHLFSLSVLQFFVLMVRHFRPLALV